MAFSPEEGEPHGVVVILLPSNGAHEAPSSSSSFVGEETIAFFEAAGDDDAKRTQKEKFSFQRATAAAAAAAVLTVVVAGYLCLYAADAWRFLVAPDVAGRQGQGASSSFLLPLYTKPQNLTPADRANAFRDRQYYTTISIGNPPKPYFLDVDTGSDLTWIQCDAPCSNCAEGRPHPLYKPAQGSIVPRDDSSCQEVGGSPSSDDTSKQCDYDIVYADGSSSLGVLARDNMQLITQDGEREHFVDVVFGCSYDQQGHLLASLENTDGILGLSGASISLPAQLAGQGIISNVFGHCIAQDPSVGGYLFLGDDYVPKWGMTWVPIRNGPGNAYSAEVQQLIHGDQQLGVRKLTRVIFDSGSTKTYFPQEAYTELIAALKDASPGFVQDDSDKTLPFCMKANFPVRSMDDVKHLFKPLSMRFKNRLFIFSRTFTIHPKDYLIISDKGNICLGVLNGAEIGYGSTIVLGDASLRGKLIAYDNGENQIGWSPSGCKEPHKQSIIPFFLRRALPNLLL